MIAILAVQGLGIQGLAGHPAHQLLHQHHHQQHPVDPYIPLMPSLSLDSFFGAYDDRDAAQRAQAPPPMMENVLPAWEDLSNGPSNSLQAAADWRVRPQSTPDHLPIPRVLVLLGLRSTCLSNVWSHFDCDARGVDEVKHIITPPVLLDLACIRSWVPPLSLHK